MLSRIKLEGKKSQTHRLVLRNVTSLIALRNDGSIERINLIKKNKLEMILNDNVPSRK